MITPLKAKILATQEAIQLAEMQPSGRCDPSRDDQSIAWVHGVQHMWVECEVPGPSPRCDLGSANIKWALIIS